MNCMGPSLNLGVALATLAVPPGLTYSYTMSITHVASFKIQTRLCTRHMQWTDCQHHNGLLIQHIMVKKDSQSHSHTPSLPEHSPVNCRKREQKKKLHTILSKEAKRSLLTEDPKLHIIIPRWPGSETQGLKNKIQYTWKPR